MGIKDYLAMSAMASMVASSPTLYGGRIQRVKRKITKCSECPEFGRKCPTSNGDMKPCSKYR